MKNIIALFILIFASLSVHAQADKTKFISQAKNQMPIFPKVLGQIINQLYLGCTAILVEEQIKIQKLEQ